VNQSFTAYGNHRDSMTWSDAPDSSELATMNAITRRAYTGHAPLCQCDVRHLTSVI
jgi:hypothetical protein